MLAMRKWLLCILISVWSVLNAQNFSLPEWLPSQTLFYGYVKNLPRIYEESFRFVSPEARQAVEQDTLYFANRFFKVHHLDQNGKLEASQLLTLFSDLEEIHFAVWDINPYLVEISFHLKFNQAKPKDWLNSFTISSNAWLRVEEKLSEESTLYRTKISALEYPFYLVLDGEYLHASHQKKNLIQMMERLNPPEHCLANTIAYQKIREKSTSEEGHYATLYLNMLKIWKLMESGMPGPIRTFYADLQKKLDISNNVYVLGSNHFLKDPISSTSFYFFVNPEWPFYQALRSPQKSFQLPQMLPSNTCFAVFNASENLVSTAQKIQKGLTLFPETIQSFLEWENTLKPLFGEEFGIFMLSKYPFQQRMDLILSQIGMIFQIKQPDILFPWLKQLEQSEMILALFPAEDWQEEHYLGHIIRWNYPPYAPFPLAYTCTKNSLIVAFSLETIQSCIQAERDGSTLANTERFKSVWSESTQTASRLIYFDPDYFLKALSAEYLPKFPISKEKPLGVGFLSYEENACVEIQWKSLQREQMYLGRIFYTLWFRAREFFKTELLWKCRFRLQSIHRAVELYHRQFQRYPASFEELQASRFLSKEFPLYCPHTSTPESYLLRPLSENASGETLLCYTNQGIWDGRNIIFLNGHVRFVTEEEFQQILKK